MQHPRPLASGRDAASQGAKPRLHVNDLRASHARCSLPARLNSAGCSARDTHAARRTPEGALRARRALHGARTTLMQRLQTRAPHRCAAADPRLPPVEATRTCSLAPSPVTWMGLKAGLLKAGLLMKQPQPRHGCFPGRSPRARSPWQGRCREPAVSATGGTLPAPRAQITAAGRARQAPVAAGARRLLPIPLER